MTPITKKLDTYLSLRVNEIKEKDFIALFGEDYKDLFIQKKHPMWKIIIFEEEKKLYSVFIKVMDKNFETFRLIKGIHRTRFYEEVDKAMINSLKEKVSFYEEELKKINNVLSRTSTLL